MTFAEKIKDYRKEMGLTQHQLADRTQIPFRTIQNWEGMTNTPQPWCQRLILAELEKIKCDLSRAD